MLSIKFQGQFKKDYKLAIKRGFNPKHFQEVVTLLVNEQQLPIKYRDHQLADSRNYHNVRECHIEPDWLLIYRIEKDELILSLIRTGTHSDLF